MVVIMRCLSLWSVVLCGMPHKTAANNLALDCGRKMLIDSVIVAYIAVAEQGKMAMLFAECGKDGIGSVKLYKAKRPLNAKVQRPLY